ncbi:hypothetical protein EBME_1209 [bacterium endosymbiont of Mortierella elongata FMR23-6]|nr:hypothetical protein EBME_1209 [bacterium endosymbiont of Mortierella elongata FMR23-6]
MFSPTQFKLPDIPREGLMPKEQGVLAWAERLAEIANGLE